MSKWTLEQNDTLYFAPASYLNEYAENDHQTLSDWLTQHYFSPKMQTEIWNGQPLNSPTIAQLAKQTGVSAKTWQNLDHRWQSRNHDQNN